MFTVYVCYWNVSVFIMIYFSHHRKLTLDSLRWMVFDKDEETVTKQFVQLVQEQLSPKEVNTLCL